MMKIKNENLLIILVYLVFFADFFSDVLRIVPRQATWLADIVNILIWLRIISSRNKLKLNKKYIFFIYGIILYFIVGSMGIFVNDSSIYIYLAGIRANFKYISAFFAVLIFFNENSFNKFKAKLIKHFITISFVQFIFNIYLKLFFNKSSLLLDFESDLFSGSFGSGGTGNLAFFQVMILLLIWTQVDSWKRSKKIIYSTIILASLFYSETAIVIIIIPLSFLIYAFFVKNSLRYFLKFAPIGIILTSIFLYLYTQSEYSKNKNTFFYLSQLLNFEESLNSKTIHRNNAFRRYFTIQESIGLLQKTNNLALGVGFGNASKSFIPIADGDLYKKYYKPYGRKVTLGLSKMLLENGLLGLLVFYGIFLIILKPFSNSDLKFVSYVRTVVSLILISNIYGVGTYGDQLSIYLWLMIAFLIRLESPYWFKKRNKEISLQPEEITHFKPISVS